MIELVPARPSHVGRIANRMRAADAAEARAWGRSPKDALRLGLRISVMAATALEDGRPEAMFGLTPANEIESVGKPWMLGTDRVPCCARSLLEVGDAVIGQMHRRFRRLENFVSVENEPAIRLLRRWGFTVETEATPVGGIDFVLFWKEAANV